MTFAVRTSPHQTNLITGEWKPERFVADFCHLVARLSDGTNEVDRIESGFIVREKQVSP